MAKLSSTKVYGNLDVSLDVLMGGVLSLTDTTASTSTTTGAVKIAGGLGVAGDIWAANLRATTAILPDANNGAALGSATVSWSDLFLASGAVINFANGDVTITHSAGKLTISDPVAATSFNGLALTAATTGFTIAGGTASRTLTVTGNATISGGTNSGDVTLATNSGLKFSSGQTGLALGTPTGLSGTSTNTITTNTHSHAIAGAALTRTNDTNVTLTLGGNSSTALLNAASLTLGWSGQLAAARGGTGLASYAVGDLLYASTTTALSKLAGVATGNVLISGGVGVAPKWGKVGLTTHITGTLATANGGTGTSSFTSGNVLIGAGTGAITTLSRSGIDSRTSFPPESHSHGSLTNDGKVGTTTNLVVVTGAGGAITTASRSGIDTRPTFPPENHSADTITSGILPVERGGIGVTSVAAKHAFMGPNTDTGAPSFRAIVAGDLPVASASAAGIVTTGTQTFAGDKTISGNLSATRVYNAVWNDIADFLEVDEDIDIEYGKAYFRDNNGKVRKTNKRNSYSIGIASDTFGFGVGRKDENSKQIPIAIGGWVLACVDNIYKAGTPLIATKDGNLTKASLLTKSFYPERIIAVFDREEKEEFWNKIKVAGRCWVKVK
jgi:hypothetical protein